MLEWLAAPIDATRAHDVGLLVSWHARLMVVSWGVAFPLGILVARFFKIWPKQNWPTELDNQYWWRGHLTLQWGGAVISLVGLGLIFWQTGLQGFWVFSGNWHRVFGWAAMLLLLIQIFGGLLRGTKGGPTQPNADGSWQGDHYSMTVRRLWFEYIHKFSGYPALLFGAVAIVLGLWQVNASNGLWLLIGMWWLVVAGAATVLQLKGQTIDTYQAIWGVDETHPGNQRKPIGWGITRRKN